MQRIWSARGLKPHLVDDLQALAMTRDSRRSWSTWSACTSTRPTTRWCCAWTRRSSIQALDRTQPSLPMTKGRAGTMTHDYKRNGTTTLFAALNVLTGTVIGQCLPRHRHEEFLRFLRTIDRQVPKGLAVHLILDNYATHKHPDVTAWLAKHPRFHLHFTPTSSLLAQPRRALVPRDHRQGHPPRRVRLRPRPHRRDRGLPRSHNDNPKPFVWTATAEDILDQDPTRPSRPRTNHRLKLRHCTSCNAPASASSTLSDTPARFPRSSWA